jgi:ribonuclease HII
VSLREFVRTDELLSIPPPPQRTSACRPVLRANSDEDQFPLFPLAPQAQPQRRCFHLPNAAVASKLKLAREKNLSPAAAKLRLLKRLRCTWKFEKRAWDGGAQLVAGVDEVGRGSLFGPVVAAAVILDPAYRIRGLRDSKLLPAERREVLAERIREHAVAWAIAAVDAARIDQINIYQASRVAMREAVLKLQPGANHLLIDAMRLDCDLPQQAIIHGDALSASIAAASILAKVERDRMIREWDPVFPVYRLASNKGYSTPHHLAALRQHGPSPLHRQSFAPVWSNPVPQEVLAFMLNEKPEEIMVEMLDEVSEAAV